MEDEDGHSPYDAEHATLTARHGHLALTFAPSSVSASGQHEASWAGGAASAGTEHELSALVRAAIGDCGGEGHLWVTEDINRDPANSDNVLISQGLACRLPRAGTGDHPLPPPAHASRGRGMSSRPRRQPRSARRVGASLTMSSPAPRSSAAAACELTAVPAGAPGVGLPLRPQRAGVNARRWVPPGPEILRRVKAALARR